MSTAARNPEPIETSSHRRRRRRLWLFRCAAVAVGLLPLVAFELLCVAFDWGKPSLHDDPFVGFRSVVPLFVPSEDGDRYEIPPARQAYFRPESFAATKPSDEFRVFCLGGSTVQGRPFAIETAFSTWLEIALAAADSTRRWEVINCGGVSYASYRLVPVLQEVLGYEPDLIVLYTGHNEFLEDRSFAHIDRRGRLLNASLEAAARLRTFSLVRQGVLALQGDPSRELRESRPILPTEVDALLDYRGGLEEYHHDETWRRGVVAHYRYNLRRMIELARQAGVRLILVNPVSNLGDSPPFKSEHRGDLSSAELAQWEATCASAHELARRGGYDLQEAIRLFERACRIDPLHAGGFYNLAGCYEAAGRFDQARAAYLQAKECDVCPLRILAEMNDAVLQIASETGTPTVDARRLFAEQSDEGIADAQWLVDHVHPSVEGHQLLADRLAARIAELGICELGDDWPQRKQQRYRAHFDSLDNHYFLQGQQRLEAVRSWAQGRAERLRPGERQSAGEP